jgi:hypothetical protein
LSDKEWDALDQLTFGPSEAKIFARPKIILMSATARSKTSIANDRRCSVGTVDIDDNSGESEMAVTNSIN